jgi:FkbM family methyltransferase
VNIRAIKDFLKFNLLPKKLYLALSAHNKKRRTLNKRWGETELELLPIIVPAERLAVDIGANNGLYTYFLSKISRNVVAYEPIHVLAHFLRQAVSSNVTVKEKAISEKVGSMDIHVPMKKGRLTYNVGSLEVGQVDGSGVRQTVDVTSLDAEDLDDVGFIKIDIEGHELSALKVPKKPSSVISPQYCSKFWILKIGSRLH